MINSRTPLCRVLCATAGTNQDRIFHQCIDILTRYQPDQLQQDKPELYDLMKGDDVVLIVNGEYKINSNHPSIKHSRYMDTLHDMNLLYATPLN